MFSFAPVWRYLIEVCLHAPNDLTLVSAHRRAVGEPALTGAHGGVARTVAALINV